MILSALLPALLAVGLLPSCIAQPSGLTKSIDEETGISNAFKPIDKRAKLTKVHKGVKTADRAEIAGLMATYRTVPYKASYFYIINEYGGDELIRQNACEHTASRKMDYNMLFVSISAFKFMKKLRLELTTLDLFQTVCVDISMFNRVTDELTFDKMYLFKMNYRWIIKNSSYQGEEILKPTLSSMISKSEDEKDFEIEFQTESYA